MPAATVPIDALALGPGYLYWAPLAEAAPTNTVSGSVFTDAWAGGWLLLGATDAGSEFNYDLTVDEVQVEEYYDPVRYITTGRQSGLKFGLAQIHATNIKRVMNGGTIGTGGTGATLLSTYTPPALGSEVRCSIGWESTDNTERMVATQCLQVGSLAVSRKKGADKAVLECEFRFEQPSSGYPFTMYFAGTARG